MVVAGGLRASLLLFFPVCDGPEADVYSGYLGRRGRLVSCRFVEES